MRTSLIMAILALALLTVSGCVMQSAPVIPPPGMIFTSYEAPLDLDFRETPAEGLRKGESSIINVLGLITVGDGGSENAARTGNISRVHYADYSFMSVLGVFSRYSTIVYGE